MGIERLEDEEAAVEVLQNVYLKVLEGKARFNKKATFKTWLFSVIRYTSMDYFRAQKQRRALFIQDQSGLKMAEETISDHQANIDVSQEQAIFKKALNELSSQQQHILHLVFYQNLTIQDAANIMNISLGTARTHYERGKQQLRKWLHKAGLPNSL